MKTPYYCAVDLIKSDTFAGHYERTIPGHPAGHSTYCGKTIDAIVKKMQAEADKNNSLLSMPSLMTDAPILKNPADYEVCGGNPEAIIDFDGTLYAVHCVA